MKFKSKRDLLLKTLVLKEIGEGSQGICYLDRSNKLVYKIYHEFFDGYAIDYNHTNIEQFCNIDNNTYIFPKDVIEVDNKVVGYIEPYVNSKDLSSINPLMINLDKLIKNIDNVRSDIETISEYGIQTYDVTYNVLYKNKFNIIDSDEYVIKDIDPSILIERNNNNFDYAIYLFLVNNYFDEFVNSYKVLKEMYQDKICDVTIFIEVLKKYLSEYIGDEVNKLNDAKECMNKVKTLDPFYIRDMKIK